MKRILIGILSLTLAIRLTGCNVNKMNDKVSINQSEESGLKETEDKHETVKEKIFVPDGDGKYAIPSIIDVSSDYLPVDLCNIVASYDNEKYYNTESPVETVEVRNSIATVNFKEDALKNDGQITLALYSLVNTLCSETNLKIDSVEFKMCNEEFELPEDMKGSTLFKMNTEILDPTVGLGDNLNDMEVK